MSLEFGVLNFGVLLIAAILVADKTEKFPIAAMVLLAAAWICLIWGVVNWIRA
jgi:hypothetical protein